MAHFADSVIAAYVQAVAIMHRSIRCTPEGLADYVLDAMESDRTAPPARGDLLQALHSKGLQAELARRDVALWRGADKAFRLVDQSPLSGARSAAARVSYHPGAKTCRFCHLEEGMPDVELVQELSRDGPVAGSYVHPQCKRAWQKVRALAEFAEVTP